ncbi:MAG: DUF2459 domain-containing protein [Balneolales bacterium]
MKKTTNGYVLIPLLVFFSVWQSCLGPVTERYPRDTDKRPVSIYVVQHGWHAGIVLPTGHIPTDLWVEDTTFPTVNFLEIGWGDRGYYQADQVTLGILMRASFWPTPSILHIAGFQTPVADYFAGSQVIEIQITEEGMKELVNFITSYFQTDKNGFAIADGGGLYGTYSSFYKAKTYYYLPKTSNTWTARALRSTGAPITPIYGLTSGNVMYQARRAGTIVNEGR